MALDRLLELAHYELEHDPYRGMQSPHTSPWSQCQVVPEINDSSSSFAVRKVFATSHCTCPSLIDWTEQQQEERKKRRNKRKRNKSPLNDGDVLGHRPTDPDFICACDFNPVRYFLCK